MSSQQQLHQGPQPTVAPPSEVGPESPVVSNTFELAQLGEGDEAGDTSDTPLLDACGLGDASNLHDVFDSIEQAYRYQHERRRDALSLLETTLAPDDSIPFMHELLLTMGSIALSAATAGIGGAVMTRLVSGAAKGVQDAVKKAVDATLLSAIKSVDVVGGGAGADQPMTHLAFVHAQRDALSIADNAAIQAVIGRRAYFRASETGLADACELLAALNANDGLDYQLPETTRQWCVYQAQAELGTAEEGTDLDRALGGTVWPEWIDMGPSLNGVLQIEVEGEDPGGPVTIVDARLEGATEQFREHLANTALDAAGIPLEVHGWVVNDNGSAYLRIGRSESGSVWVDGGSTAQERYLYLRAGGSPVSRLTPVDFAETRFDGAQAVLAEDILPVVLTKQGMAIDG